MPPSDVTELDADGERYHPKRELNMNYGVTTGCILVYCYIEFKLRYLKNLKSFSKRIKELFEPIVLRKKAERFLLFLKAFS